MAFHNSKTTRCDRKPTLCANRLRYKKDFKDNEDLLTFFHHDILNSLQRMNNFKENTNLISHPLVPIENKVHLYFKSALYRRHTMFNGLTWYTQSKISPPIFEKTTHISSGLACLSGTQI